MLATVDRAGRAHAVPVWFTWDGEALRIVTGRDSAKHRNIERTGRATLCIDEREGRYGFVTAEGPVTVQDLTYEDRLALYTHYRGEESAKRVVDQGGHEQMVLLVLRPERWYGWTE